MRLLICTQAVDLDDPVLGFFHRWVEELSKRFEAVHVICLKEGRHELPKNVFIHSLGKEGGRSRLKYLFRFYRYIREFRGEYDVVFVHMNQEYVLLGWKLWWLWGKRIVLWRNHLKGSWLTWLATKVSHNVCYTSPEAFVATCKNAVLMPIGIDTGFFSPALRSLGEVGPSQTPKPDSILFLGRLDPVKKVDTFVRALKLLQEQGASFWADIIGDPTEAGSKYAHDVRNLATVLSIEGMLSMRGAVTNQEARDLFRSHAIYCNLTPSGSFDKTIGEAMASGCVVAAVNHVLQGILPKKLMPQDDSDEAAAQALRGALDMPEPERRALAQKSRSYIEREHSLSLLVERLFGILAA
ncbi:MAG TPA: glycosyltransferase family 4 protein [Candidatus Paceibacterota bacterium]|nr:glycosyltransferase family 4 protein [Candidatus Paceibacterota bacterium]